MNPASARRPSSVGAACLGGRRRGAWSTLVVGAVLLAGPAPGREETVTAASTGTLISSNVSQVTNGIPNANYTITNSNPGAIFNSATVDFEGQFGGVLSYVLEHNASLKQAGITTLAQLLSNNAYVKISIDSTSNVEVVNVGWDGSIHSSTGILSFAPNNPFSWDIWRSSTDGEPHTLKYTIVFGDNTASDPKLKNIFDLNGDGVVQASERLVVAAAPPISPWFVGYEGIFEYTAPLPVYQIQSPLQPPGPTLAEALAAAGLSVTLSAAEPGEVELRFGVLAGFTYTLWHNAGLAPEDWAALGAPVAAAAAATVVEHHRPAPFPQAHFYKVQIEPTP